MTRSTKATLSLPVGALVLFLVLAPVWAAPQEKGVGQKTLLTSNPPQEPIDRTIAPADVILGDEKASLEWINLRLQASLTRERIARLDKEATELEKQADEKLLKMREASKVPPDYEGTLRGNHVVFTRPVKPKPDKP
jgi:hypothetical protein